MKDFITPPNHVNFLAAKLFGSIDGKIADGAVAHMQKGGGGPVEMHTHPHSHLFIVTKGEAKIILDGKEVIVGENESYLVDGNIPHSVWNNIDDETVMVGITINK